MIEHIRIRGLGVIDEAQMEFGPGLTVLTGETGAGKTMILTSLRLLMGGKADAALVRDGHRQIEIDGTFRVPSDLRATIEDLGVLLEDETLIISRTVPREGRSKATLNGRPVPLRTLEEITGALVTVHGQSDQWRMRREHVQRQMLDRFGGAAVEQANTEYQKRWKHAVAAKKHLDRLHNEHDQTVVEIQYLSDVVSAIDALGPRPGEEHELVAEIERLSNVEDLARLVNTAVQGISGANETSDGALDLVGQALGRLRQAEKHDPHLEEATALAADIEIRLGELADQLADYLDDLRDDPDRLLHLHERLSDLESLMKGRATSTEELLDWYQKARERLEALTGAELDPQVAAEQLAQAQESVRTAGRDLSELRRRASTKLETGVNAELTSLGMGGAAFRVRMDPTAPQPHGLEQITMELRGRPDSPFRPLGEGASGGELSRILLALEVAMGETSQPGTYVFDEVDAGVAGRTALDVGARLAALAQNQQVLVVTHLPQVAVNAQTQLVVQRAGNETVVHAVSDDARTDEIVRMLGAEEDSEAARRHAVELLQTHSCDNTAVGQ